VKRSTQALLVAGSSWAARVAAALAILTALFLLSQHVSIDELAAFGIAASLSMWMYQSELGLAVAMQNLTVKYRSDPNRLSVLVGRCFVLSALLLAIICGVGWAVAPVLGNLLFHRLPGLSPQDGVDLVRVALVVFAVQGHGQIGMRILYGRGAGVTANFLVLLGHLTGLILLGVVTYQSSTRPASVGLSLALVSIPLSIVSYGAWTYIFLRFGTMFGTNQAWLKEAAIPAISYWLLNVQSIAAHHSDYFIAAFLLSAEQIALLAFGQRVLAIAVSIYNSLVGAYWPHWSAMVETGRWDEIRRDGRALYRGALLIIYPLTAAALIGAILAISNFSIHLVNREDLPMLAAGGLAYLTFRLHTETTAGQLMAAGEFAWMARRVSFQIVLSVVMQILLAQHFGVAGLWLGLAAAIAGSTFWLWARRVQYLAQHQTLARVQPG
jgi:O-antigen/teichoic acid export membrane protein